MKKEKSATAHTMNPRQAQAAGPSLYEVEYLRQLKVEMELFLRSKNFSTIQQFDIGFAGQGYTGHMQVHA